jgi:quinol monooxygenase YgiN
VSALALPWRPGPAAGAEAGEVVVLGSRLELAAVRDLPAFLRASLRLRRAAARAPGGLGLALLADLRRLRFWTLSAWIDQDALDAFTASPAHRQVMRRFRGRLRASQFETWPAATPALPPSWDEVRDRLSAGAGA